MKNMFLILITFLSFSSFASNLIISVPTSVVLDEKYSVGFGVIEKDYRLKIDFGTQYNRGSFKRLSSKNDNWSRFHFSNYQFQKAISEDKSFLVGTSLHRVMLKINNNNLDPEAYHLQLSLLKGFRYKIVEIQPEISYSLPISDKHDIFKNYLKKEVRFEINLGIIF